MALSFLRGAFYGGVAGVISFFVLLWLVMTLQISFSNSPGGSLVFDATYFAVPIFLLCFGVAVVVYNVLRRRPLFSSTVDGLLIGLAVVLNLLAIPALMELQIIGPPA